MVYPSPKDVVSATSVAISEHIKYGKRHMLMFPLNADDVMAYTNRHGRVSLPIAHCRQLSMMLLSRHVLSYECLSQRDRMMTNRELGVTFGGVTTEAVRKSLVSVCRKMSEDRDLLQAYHASADALIASGFRLFDHHKMFNPCQ